MAWTVYTRDVEGTQAQILVDDHFDWTAPVQDLTNLGVIAVYCNQQPVSTLWHPEEGDALDTIEERLINFCDKYSNGWGLYVMRMATYGVREYYIYFGDQADIYKAFEELKKMHPDYRIEFSTVADPEWKHYRSFVKTK